MTPKALTDQEKDRQRQRLIQQGEALVMAHGLRKISVDEITSAAGMAKGAFYLHFASKEAFLLELIRIFLLDYFQKAEAMVLHGEGALPDRVRAFLRSLFTLPETIFFFRNHGDLEYVMQSVSGEKSASVKNIEQSQYAHLLSLAGVDIGRVKPGVVHNLIHVMYMTLCEDLMTREDVGETFEVLLDSAMRYIFGVQ